MLSSGGRRADTGVPVLQRAASVPVPAEQLPGRHGAAAHPAGSGVHTEPRLTRYQGHLEPCRNSTILPVVMGPFPAGPALCDEAPQISQDTGRGSRSRKLRCAVANLRSGLAVLVWTATTSVAEPEAVPASRYVLSSESWQGSSGCITEQGQGMCMPHPSVCSEACRGRAAG